jgi:hypothetical protein
MKTLLLILICFFLQGQIYSQTKPRTTAKKTTTSTKKKAAPKEINVYVCTSEKDKYYHKRSSCGGLNKCSTEIKNIKSAAMLGKYKRKKCTRCFSM